MADSAKNPQQFLPLTAAEFQIMLVLADEDRHGYGIMQEVETRSKGSMQMGPGTLYTTIKRLLEREWIEEIEAPATSDDPRRKYYHLTSFGERVVRAEADRLAALVDQARRLGLVGGAS